MAQGARTITILGKSGSGKDTQVGILAEKLEPALVVSTGEKFRQIEESDTLFGRKTKEMLKDGGLMPHWYASYAWKDEFIENLKGDENILMGSSPRRLKEAEELDVVIEWLERQGVEAVLIEISDEESLKRMLKRGREYDTKDNIKKRLNWFSQNVMQVIEHYEWHGRLHKVNGEQSIQDVAKDVAKALKIK